MHRFEREGTDLVTWARSRLAGFGPSIALADVTDLSEGWEHIKLDETPPFKCESYISHGPGHQSRTKCESRMPHPIEGDHWARDPMSGDFEWAGPSASTGY